MDGFQKSMSSRSVHGEKSRFSRSSMETRTFVTINLTDQSMTMLIKIENTMKFT